MPQLCTVEQLGQENAISRPAQQQRASSIRDVTRNKRLVADYPPIVRDWERLHMKMTMIGLWSKGSCQMMAEDPPMFLMIVAQGIGRVIPAIRRGTGDWES